MEKPKDYYSILGVNRDATTATIRRAYRRLAKKLHPDTAQKVEPEAFLDLQAAYETLTDAARRRRYDQRLRQAEREKEPLSWSLLRNPGELRRPIRPGSLNGEILLTPQEAGAGGILPLDVPVTTSCPSCDGTGGFAFDCGRCDGEGKVERRLPVPLRIPPNVRDGTVFQVALDEPAVMSIFLTVHIRRV